MKILKYTFISFFVITGFCSIMAQSNKSNSNDTIQNSLKKCSLSLQFGIAANLSLQAFNNYSISIKYHISPKSALRFGVGGDFSNKKGTITTDSIQRNVSSFGYNYSLELCYLLYFNPISTINIFTGAGPLANISFSSYYRPYGDKDFDYHTTNSWGIGPKIIAGGEWFFMRKLSLFAEYEAEWSWGKYKEYSHYTYQDEEHKTTLEQDIFQFIGNTARLGLSIYF